MNPLIVIAAAGAAWVALSNVFGKKKIFISYYYKDDNHYKNLLKAWSKNADFDIDFLDNSVDISVRSNDEAAIRRTISRKIKASDIVLVIVGKKTHRRKWVSWEIEKATQLGKKLIAVKIDKSCKSPQQLLSVGAIWINSFSYEDISKALDRI